ncbi:MAG: protein kinase domain-containing protein, partial [bacterium]
ATAIAISHEAGCINSDIKPANMMVTKDFSLLKLIDQGAIINLTEGITNVSSYTPDYASPEAFQSHMYHSLVIAGTPDVEEKSVSPAIDVYSLGVTILEKLSTLNGASEEIKQIRELFKKEPVVAFENIGESKNLFGTPEESKFIGQLLQDCLAVKPEDRISAAQVAEILQVFSSYLEEKETKPDIECPNYDTVKGMAIEDCPKAIPIALRKMLFHSDRGIQQKAISIIEKLVEADPSYKSTPSYGMVSLLQSNNAFSTWTKDYPDALKQLKDRTYILGQECPDKDMPVSKEVYNRIQAFKLAINS